MNHSHSLFLKNSEVANLTRLPKVFKVNQNVCKCVDREMIRDGSGAKTPSLLAPQAGITQEQKSSEMFLAPGDR